MCDAVLIQLCCISSKLCCFLYLFKFLRRRLDLRKQRWPSVLWHPYHWTTQAALSSQLSWALWQSIAWERSSPKQGMPQLMPFTPWDSAAHASSSASTVHLNVASTPARSMMANLAPPLSWVQMTVSAMKSLAPHQMNVTQASFGPSISRCEFKLSFSPSYAPSHPSYFLQRSPEGHSCGAIWGWFFWPVSPHHTKSDSVLSRGKKMPWIQMAEVWNC